MKPGDQISSPATGPLRADITSQEHCSISSLGSKFKRTLTSYGEKLLTAWRRVLLEKLTVAQLVKK
jgi:hypothetical protein